MNELAAGEATVEITPPLGIDLGGFYIPQGKERKVTSVRQPSYARALVLRCNCQQIAIVSLDLLNLSLQWVNKVRAAISTATGILVENIHLCVTHTHSMPSLRFIRRCGEVSPAYCTEVMNKVIKAVKHAQGELLPAHMYLGHATVVNGSYNRTVTEWKTENKFDDRATYVDRWLDRTLNALSFRCKERDRDIVWYHFSAHPACNNDTIAWPNWPGLVADKLRTRRGINPSFLQGHCGDVHAGPGQPRLGDPEVTSEAIVNALERALDDSTSVEVESIEACSAEIELPLDIKSLQDELNRYREHPETFTGEGWFDSEFVADWARGASLWDPNNTMLKTVVSSFQLGDIAMLFHGSELCSYYGLMLQHHSPFRKTISVGLANDYVGYLADPLAYENQEYAACTAPRIFDLPPFQTHAADSFVYQAIQLLNQLNENRKRL